ncbi:MAG: hypothetical protein EPO40_19445 [Myxococcaceae bacterium]|nr:MAG: hypothetical protein EPO40_19445 [Myxococcaceae bacterium]
MTGALDAAEGRVQHELRKSAPPRLSITRRHALTLWAGDGLPSAVVSATPLLLEARPAVVQLHAGPQGLRDHLRAAALRVRATVPGVALWVGVAWDGWVDEVTAATVERVLERVYLPAARAAAAVGAELLVINSEAAGKIHPAAARLLAVRAIDIIRAECPGLLLGHTAYDHPHYHPEERDHGGKIDADEEGYPWSAYLGGAAAKAAGVELPKSGPVDLELPQRYAAPAKPEGRPQPMAGVGSLQRRIAGSAASFARASALGWIDPAIPVLSYVQAHHVRAEDTAAVGASQPLALWAAPTRIDDHGRRALRVLCAAERGELGADLGQTDWPVITAWAQGRVGAVGDGQWGAKSTAAALAWLRARGLDGDGRFGAELLKALQVRP